jgi:hypothetical protein
MRRILSALFVLAAVAAPRPVLACAVCFGQSDSPMAWGTNMGIFLMLGVTGAVLGGFAAFFVYLMRRAKLAAGVEAPATRPYVLPRADVQEGIASC